MAEQKHRSFLRILILCVMSELHTGGWFVGHFLKPSLTAWRGSKHSQWLERHLVVTMHPEDGRDYTERYGRDCLYLDERM